MSTSDESPLEEGREIFHSMCDRSCGPECTVPEDGWKIGPGQVIMPEEDSKKVRAEARHRAEIEPYAARDRRLPFPWGMAIVGGVVGGATSFLIWFAGNGLGWW